jgi:hypothetical protein
MAKKSRRKTDDADIETILSAQLGQPVGEELAEKLLERYDGISSDMARSEAIARVMTQKAAGGDLAAAKYIFETAKRKEEKERQIPFVVEYEMVEDEV